MSSRTILLVLSLCLISLSFSFCGKEVPTKPEGPGILRGDIDQNGTAFEKSDAEMLIAYFAEGESAFGNHVEASTEAADVNNNGSPLELADLSFLTGVINGFFDSSTPTRPSTATCEIVGEYNYYEPDENGDMPDPDYGTVVYYNCQEDIASIRFTYILYSSSSIFHVDNTHTSMDYYSYQRNDTLIIVANSLDGKVFLQHQYALALLLGGVYPQIIGVEVANKNGATVPSSFRKVINH
ncbi:MAG: hypothetical protein R3F48_06950 [Candidatus Zixiibacteriota bacterium]